MLYAPPQISPEIKKIEKREDALYLSSDRGKLRLLPMTGRTIRITYTENAGFSDEHSDYITAEPCPPDWDCQTDRGNIILTMPGLELRINRKTASISFWNPNGTLRLKERETNSRSLERFTAMKLEKACRTERVETADGIKEYVTDAVRVPCRELYHTRVHYEWQEGEALYGLGQQEEGALNLRGQYLYLHQGNRKISIPFLLSSLGYGILINTGSPVIFSDSLYGSYLYTEAVPEMDYYFINGGDMNATVAEYRRLTGKASMLPRWAFGYLQSQERYETQEEILQIADEHRRRGISLDGIVLDWCSWSDGLWGQKTLDKTRFPDMQDMIRQLHEKNIHFMISIWPNMDSSTENYREFHENNLLLPASDIYNAFDQKGRELYWKQVREELFRSGTDAWWCDSSEPFAPEWGHRERPEPAVLYSEYVREVSDRMPADKLNAYSFYHAMGIYEGQRRENSSKRVFNLTRSAYIGQQRFGTVLWSGDTAASWDTLRRQIAAGLNFCASGLPYWTSDIGAFFVKKSRDWYWDGDYNNTAEDPAYRELFVRWYQWGCFLPVFRGHGTDCRRELWRISGTDHEVYQALLRMNKLRYELMPYIYSAAGKVWLEDQSIMKMLAFDFPDDPAVLNISDQYMFGESIMVCPVTSPLYFKPDGTEIAGDRHTRRVYLPGKCCWYDFWTGRKFGGGIWIDAQAPLERIPLFVRAGSIIPVSEAAASTAERMPAALMVYPGQDAAYELYEDSGDGYDYENGKFSLRKFFWSEKEQTLTDEEGHPVPCHIISQK